MPKRTNTFQIQTYLFLKSVYPDARVTHSAMVWDSAAECEREVDVLIERPNSNGGTIAYEVTAPSRRTSVQWTEQMIGKYGTLAVKDVNLISSAGFTKSALRKARSTDNVNALEIQSTKTENWNSDLGSSGWFERLTSELDCSVRYVDRQGNEHIQRLEHGSIIIWSDRKLRVIDACSSLFNHAAQNDESYSVMNQKNGEPIHFRMTGGLSELRFEALPDDCEVVELYVGLVPNFHRWQTSIRTGRLQGHEFAYLESTDPNNLMIATLVETEPGVIKGSLAEPAPNAG